MNRKLLQEVLGVLKDVEFRSVDLTEDIGHFIEECPICWASNRDDNNKQPVHLANCEMDSVIRNVQVELAISES